MRILSTRDEDHQYPWGIPSVPIRIYVMLYHVVSNLVNTLYEISPIYESSRICSKKIISTLEAYRQYPLGFSVPVKKIISTCEDMQYLGVKLHSFFIQTDSLIGRPTEYPHSLFAHRYWWSSLLVPHILTGIDDLPHVYCSMPYV